MQSTLKSLIKLIYSSPCNTPTVWPKFPHLTHLSNPLCFNNVTTLPPRSTLNTCIHLPTVYTTWHLLFARGRWRHLSTIDVGLVWCVYLRKGSSGGSYTRKEGVDGVFMQLLVVPLCPHRGTECNNKKFSVRLYICDLWLVATFPCVVKACPPRPNTIQDYCKYVHRPFPIGFVSSRRRSASRVKLWSTGGPPSSCSFRNHTLDMGFFKARLASVIYFMPVNLICSQRIYKRNSCVTTALKQTK